MVNAGRNTQIETTILKNNDFRFLLTMPTALNEAIETASFSLRRSKSAFIRESVRRYLREMNCNGSDEKKNGSLGTLSRPFAEFCQRPWGLFMVWFFVSLAVTSIFLYYWIDVLKSLPIGE